MRRRVGIDGQHRTAWLLVGLGLAGCAGPAPQARDDAAINTGLAHLMRDPAEPAMAEPIEAAPPGPLVQAAERAALDLERLLAASASATGAGATTAMLAPAEAADASLAHADLADPARTAGPQTDEHDPQHNDAWLMAMALDPMRAAWREARRQALWWESTVLEPMMTRAAAGEWGATAETRLHDRAAELASMLIEQASTSPDPARELALVAALDALAPGRLDAALAELPVAPSQVEAVRALAEAMASVWQGRSGSLSDHLRAAADRLAEAAPMRIAHATLCTRVMGFGRYEPFAQDEFVAGRPQRMIVYVEIEQFGHRPVRMADVADRRQYHGERWAVELSQALELYREGERAPVWSRPEQTVIESSRNRRRDFYLVHEIELPATLPAGAYTLKIIMRDRTTGALDEAHLPLRLLAEARSWTAPAP